MHESPAADAAGAAATTSSHAPSPSFCRVASLTICDLTFEVMDPMHYSGVLWGALDRCVVPAEQRFHHDRSTHSAHFGGGGITNADIRTAAALVKIDVMFPDWQPANISILGPLTTDYPAALVRSLQVLKIAHNDYDESAALGAFAALATRLTELTCFGCGLSSVQGLEGRCEYLRKVNFSNCNQLSSIDGMEDRVHLEEIDASWTSITSIDPLRSCPSLTEVNINCRHLSSLDALEGHQMLQVVFASSTGITSIEPLRTCPNLTRVNISFCPLLSSIEALADHQCLQEVYLADTPITSIDPLRSCPRLTAVVLCGCRQLPADVGLPTCVKVTR